MSRVTLYEEVGVKFWNDFNQALIYAKQGKFEQFFAALSTLESAIPIADGVNEGRLRLCWQARETYSAERVKGPSASMPSETTVAASPVEILAPNEFCVEHLDSRLKTAHDPRPTICVLTPVLNGREFLHLTLESVISQRGDFFIDYCVKDAGSADGTLELLKQLAADLALGTPPLNCAGIRFRYESVPDQGLYDGLAYGFRKFAATTFPKTISTYINSDDIYADGAFATVAKVFGATPARWICGQIHVIDSAGRVLVTPNYPMGYASRDIAEGLHDGQSLPVIQQEGCFWLRELYDEVGGMNQNLRLAGDFDLWRRFAERTELLALNRPLASFRSRPGQLSERMDDYYAEIAQLYPSNPIAVAGDEHDDVEEPLFFWESHSPNAARQQRPGPVCFLSLEGNIQEIAYLKRAWLTG